MSATIKTVIMTAMTAGLFSLPLQNDISANEQDYQMRTSERVLSGYMESPRTSGLGGSHAAVYDGAHGTYTNPAMLGALGKAEGFNTASAEQVRDDDKHTTYTTITIGGAMRLNDLLPNQFGGTDTANQGVGLRYSHVYGNTDDMESPDFGTNLFSIGYGRSFNSGRVLAGVSFTFHSTHIDDVNWEEEEINRYELRTGVLLRVTNRFSIGGVYSFGNGEGDGESTLGAPTATADIHSYEWRIGAAMRLYDEWLITGDLAHREFDIEQPGGSAAPSDTHKITRLSVGSEWTVLDDDMVVRGGLFYGMHDWEREQAGVQSAEENSYLGGAVGASYFFKDWTIDYNAEATTNGDHGHHISANLEF